MNGINVALKRGIMKGSPALSISFRIYPFVKGTPIDVFVFFGEVNQQLRLTLNPLQHRMMEQREILIII